jgi:hypothetical protein
MGAARNSSVSNLATLKPLLGVRLFFLVFLAFSCFSLVATVPTNLESLDSVPQKRDPLISDGSEDIEKRSAGLLFGPHNVGNLKIYLTNPHVGPAGPKFPSAEHVNLHVDRKAPRNTYVEVVNLHIVNYSHAGKFCLYVWDSVSKKTVFDSCFDALTHAATEGVKAIKNFIGSLLKAADFFAAILIIAALGVALAAAIASLGVVVLV